MLKIALDNYDDLVSKTTTDGKNSEEKITGEAIYQGYKQGAHSFVVMGRQGGLNGEYPIQPSHR